MYLGDIRKCLNPMNIVYCLDVLVYVNFYLVNHIIKLFKNTYTEIFRFCLLTLDFVLLLNREMHDMLTFFNWKSI